MLEAYEYDYGTAILCDDHYVLGESSLNLYQIKQQIVNCIWCSIVMKEDD